MYRFRPLVWAKVRRWTGGWGLFFFFFFLAEMVLFGMLHGTASVSTLRALMQIGGSGSM